ncbi:MAG: hypothetical protein JW934_06230 [Anaerolineae bacterium]|nr:hypothetical protein [Anaerolineae bacterium]
MIRQRSWCVICFLLVCLIGGCASPIALPAETTTPLPAAALPAASLEPLPLPLCDDPQPSRIVDLEVRRPPALAEPSPRVPFRDPVFGACLVRVTDRRADLSAGDASPGIKTEYARVPAFNADGRYLLLRSIEANWYLYDARSLHPLAQLPLVNEPRWDARNPNLIYYTEETRLMAYDVSTGQAEVVHDFAVDVPAPAVAVWTRYEGRPSRDTRTWGLMAEDGDWLPIAFLIYDLDADRVTVRDVRGVPGIEEDVDHVTVSPLGAYFLASFDRACDRGALGTDARPCGLMAYDRELRQGRGLLRIAGHYDTALDAQGREVVVYQDIDSDHIAMLDLATGQATPLWAIDFSHTPLGFHFSGLAYERPGWVLASTYSGGDPDAFTWMDDQVFVLELKAGGRVVRLAHTHSRVDPEQEHDYWAEPHATTNSDLTRVLFTSNWGRSGSEQIEVYLIDSSSIWP